VSQEQPVQDEQVEQEPVQGMQVGQDWYARIEAEILRQGAALLRLGADRQRQGQMLELLLQHFHIQYPPPGPQVEQEPVQGMQVGQDWYARIEAEQLRQDAEQQRIGQMLELLLQHHHIQYPPPGPQ
jgi:hypothetical protein